MWIWIRFVPVIIVVAGILAANDEAQAFAKSLSLFLMALLLWPFRKATELVRGRSR